MISLTKYEGILFYPFYPYAPPPTISKFCHIPLCSNQRGFKVVGTFGFIRFINYVDRLHTDVYVLMNTNIRGVTHETYTDIENCCNSIPFLNDIIPLLCVYLSCRSSFPFTIVYISVHNAWCILQSKYTYQIYVQCLTALCKQMPGMHPYFLPHRFGREKKQRASFSILEHTRLLDWWYFY